MSFLRGTPFNINFFAVLSLLDLLIFLPLLGAAAMAFGAPARQTALAVAGACLALGLYLLAAYDHAAAGMQFTAFRPILDSPKFGYNVGLDGISLAMVLLTVLVLFAAVWVKPGRVGGEKMYYASILLLAAGAAGAFISTDLVFFYAFHELALIPTFLMIGMRGTGENREAAWKITIYLGLGSVILLAGLAWLTVAAGHGALSFDMQDLRAGASTLDAGTQANLYALLLIGFGVLISLFPFHSWAPQAYASAPLPITMLHAGVLKKFGLYGLLRIAPMLPEGAATEWVQKLLLLLLLGNILFVGFVTIAQKELDMVLANSSVMHMGYIFLGIASGSAIGYGGAVMLMFAHGVSIALLFALATAVRERTGTLQFHRLGGLAAHAPFLGVTFAMGAFASIGLPGFANFAGEINIFFGAFDHWDHTQPLGLLQWTTILALWGVVMSAVYMLRAFRRVFKGEVSEISARGSDLTGAERLPAVLLLAALLAVGFVPGLLMNAIKPAVESLVPMATPKR